MDPGRIRSIARRRVAVVATIAVLLVAGCSGSPSTSDAPASQALQSAAASAPAPLSSTAAEASSSALPSGEPSTAVSPEPSDSSPTGTPTTGGWISVLPPLTPPAAYIDLGFAGNGDLMVLGTDDITQRPAAAWIARYAADGTRTARVTIGRKVQLLPTRDFFHVDPTNDSLVFTEVDFATGYWHAVRISSTTGKLVENLKLDSGASYVVPTPAGKLLNLTPTYGGPNNERACVIVRVGANGGIASGIDYFTEPCRTAGYSKPPAYFGTPVSIDIANGGNVLYEDWAEAGFRRDKEPAGLGLSVLTPALKFVRHFHLPTDWQVPDTDRGLSRWGDILAGDSAGRIYLLNEVRSADATQRLGLRLGVFDASGTLVTVYGVGGSTPGLDGPLAARVDGADRLWVVDLDTAAKAYVVKRLDGTP